MLLATGEGPADPKAQLGPPTSALSPIYGLAYRRQKWKNFEKSIPLGDFPPPHPRQAPSVAHRPHQPGLSHRDLSVVA